MDWPDWEDAGKRVELDMPDGARVVGRLEINDFISGEDEVPIFSVRTDDGMEVPFANADQWRFTPPTV